MGMFLLNKLNNIINIKKLTNAGPMVDACFTNRFRDVSAKWHEICLIYINYIKLYKFSYRREENEKEVFQEKRDQIFTDTHDLFLDVSRKYLCPAAGGAGRWRAGQYRGAQRRSHADQPVHQQGHHRLE